MIVTSHTWGNGTVPIAVATVLGGFLTFIWFCYLIFATITSNNDGDQRKIVIPCIPFMTNHDCNCTVFNSSYLSFYWKSVPIIHVARCSHQYSLFQHSLSPCYMKQVTFNSPASLWWCQYLPQIVSLYQDIVDEMIGEYSPRIGTVNYSQKHGSCAGEASKTSGSGDKSALAAGCSLLTALYIRT